METKIMLSALAIIIVLIGTQPASASKYIHTPGDLDTKDIYQLGYNVGYNDGVRDGVYHHVYDDFNNTTWSNGYLQGFSAGCEHTGRSIDECDLQTDASTP
jgi:hypothetical protein